MSNMVTFPQNFRCTLPPSVSMSQAAPLQWAFLNNRDHRAKMPHWGRSGKRQKHEKAKADPVTTLFHMAVGLMAWFVEVKGIHSSLYLSVRLKCVVREDMDLIYTHSAARTSGVLKKGVGGGFPHSELWRVQHISRKGEIFEKIYIVWLVYWLSFNSYSVCLLQFDRVYHLTKLEHANRTRLLFTK